MHNLIGGVAVIENKGKHLLIKQSHNKPFGGQWRHPGGKFKPDEASDTGVKREAKEETGLNIELTDKQPVMVMKSDYEDGYFGFFTARITGGKLAIDKREIEDAEWFAIKDIKKMSLMKATKKFYEKF